MPSDGLIAFTFTPEQAYRAEEVKMTVQVRGGTKLDEQIALPVLPQPKAELKVSS